MGAMPPGLAVARRTLLAAVCGAILWVAAPARAENVPGVLAKVTISGKSSGSQQVTFPAQPADPDFGCAAVSAYGYTSDGTVDWSVSYSGLLLSLKKATGMLFSRRPPKSSGGARGGSLSLSGNYRVPGAYGCGTLAPFSFSSTLRNASGRRALPSMQRSTGFDLFFMTGGLEGSPPSFSLAGSDGTADSVGELMPFYLAPDASLFGTQSSRSVEAGPITVGINWNKLQGKLRSLRHRKSFRLRAHGSYAKTFGGIGGDAADSNGVITDCDEAKDDYHADDPSFSTTCTENTVASYTITVTRQKFVTIVRG